MTTAVIGADNFRGRSRLVAMVSLVVVAAAMPWGEPRADEEAFAFEVVTEHPQPMIAAATPDYRPRRISVDADRTEAILQELESTEATLSFAETPLADVVEAVAAKAGIDAGIDSRALEDAGIDPESPVNGSSKDRRLLDAMRSMVDPLGLAVVVRHGRLLVTTHERSHDPAYLQVFLYPVLPGADPAEVRDMVEATVAPETWDTVGGSGTVRLLPAAVGTGIVVAQTEENHERIAALLRGLDRAIWEADGDAAHPARIMRTHPVADPEIRDALADRLVDLCNDALPDGEDPEASVQVVGESIVVQSASRAFHVMAASIITAIEGVESILIEETDEDEPAPTVQATSSRRATARRR
jgi:hypothetical protein